MVGQCIFCSWYGVRLRPAPYLGRGAKYHPHCVRVAMSSPDAADRTRAEEIVRTELPLLARERFWEINSPNKTLSPDFAVTQISADECREMSAAQALAGPERIQEFLPRESRRTAELGSGTHGSTSQPSLPAMPEEWSDRCAAARQLCEGGLSIEEAAGRLGLQPRTVAAWARNGWQRRNRPTRTNVDRAVDMVSRLSGAEMDEFRDRLTGMIRCLLPIPPGEQESIPLFFEGTSPRY